MLFLKRLSDRFDEECEALASVKGADPEEPDEHDFFVPKRARWAELQKTASNLGETLKTPIGSLSVVFSDFRNLRDDALGTKD